MTTVPIRHVAVIDIGKTNAKVALVDLESRSEVALRRMPNGVATDGLYPHYDVERLWSFILTGLAEVNRERPVDAISVTTHGATAALVDASGDLALPILDYEFDGPDRLAGDYDQVRPAFSETGTPRLPMGLNLGAQIFWQQRSFPGQFAKAASILMYPQYWTFRLTGVVANEVTSLGCHTDLWNPAARDYSSLVETSGWRPLMAPVRPAADQLGVILPQVATATGLRAGTPVFCGIHDSNASLLPHVLSRKPPFAVVSTGTWVVCMAVGGLKVALDPARDTLINVNALGDPVPSARFMGGREYETLTGGRDGSWRDDDVGSVLEASIMLLPSVQRGSGPFPDMQSCWTGDRNPSPAEHAVATAFYLAMMTATCLDLIGAEGEIILEGPFAANRLYVDMLRAATERPVAPQAGQATGTSIGAALLAGKPLAPSTIENVPLSQPCTEWLRYADTWRAAAAAARARSATIWRRYP